MSTSELRCYNCGELGHISRNCPTGNSVTHNGKKTPGTSNFSVEVLAVQPDSDSIEEVEVLDSLPLRAISFKGLDLDIEEINKFTPPWVSDGLAVVVRSKLGDCYVMNIEFMLHSWDHYPGDEKYDSIPVINFGQRFLVVRNGNAESYRIVDLLTRFRIIIPMKLLQRPYFDIRSWYAKWRAKALHLQKQRLPYWMFGSLLEDVPSQLLKDGIRSSYPSIKINGEFSEFRFAVERASSTSDEDYVVRDFELELDVPITRTSLMNPDFDLVGWYRDYLDENQHYHTQYESATIELMESLQKINTLSEDSIDSGIESDGSIPDLAQALPFMEKLPDLPRNTCEEEATTTPVNQSSNDLTSSFTKGLDGYWVGVMGDAYAKVIVKVLTHCQPFPGDPDRWIDP